MTCANGALQNVRIRHVASPRTLEPSAGDGVKEGSGWSRCEKAESIRPRQPRLMQVSQRADRRFAGREEHAAIGKNGEQV
jgi:hypothetical protein